MSFNFSTLNLFHFLAISFWGAGGGVTTIPVAYLAASSPYWETSWKPSLGASEPILDCPDISDGDFKVYLRLKPESSATDPNRVVLHTINSSDEEVTDESSNAFINEESMGWQFKFDREGRATITINQGSRKIECNDSKIRPDITSASEVTVDGIRLEVNNAECVKRVSQVKCDVKFSAANRQLDWKEGFKPQLVYSAF